MAEKKKVGRKKRINYDDFIRRWWRERFPSALAPEWDSAISCADAADLLAKFERHLQQGKRGGR